MKMMLTRGAEPTEEMIKMLMTSKNREGEEVKFMVMMVTEGRRAAMEIQMARRGRSCPWWPESLLLGAVDGGGSSDNSATEQGEEEMLCY